MAEPGHASSPLAEALARVGDRWTLLVVEALLPGPRRFNDLLSQIPGIAANILSDRLKRLERDGLLAARPYSRRPPRGARQLTADGTGTRRGAPPARPLGEPAHRPGRLPASPCLRHSHRGPLVLPHLRSARRPRAGSHPGALRVTGNPGRPCPGGRGPAVRRAGTMITKTGPAHPALDRITRIRRVGARSPALPRY